MSLLYRDPSIFAQMLPNVVSSSSTIDISLLKLLLESTLIIIPKKSFRKILRFSLESVNNLIHEVKGD